LSKKEEKLTKKIKNKTYLGFIQGDRKNGKKSPNFWKSSQNSHLVQKCKYFFTETLFESQKHQHQTTFETLKFTKTSFESDCLRKNVKKAYKCSPKMSPFWVLKNSLKRNNFAQSGHHGGT
jgi:hypothetical protein